MKRFLLIMLCLALSLSLFGCGNKQEPTADTPPGISALQNQMTLKKHSPRGETASFSEKEIERFLGEDISFITIETLPENGALVCNGASVTKGQMISASNLDYLKFVPFENCNKASFNFSCDNFVYGGNQIGCELVFNTESDLPPAVVNSEIRTYSGITCFGDLPVTEPNGDEFTVNVIDYPTDGYISVSANGSVVYTPESNFSGTDKMVYTVTDCYGNTSQQATLSIFVEKNESGIVFEDMKNDPMHTYAHKMCRDNIMVYRSEKGKYYFDPQATVTKMEFLVMVMCVTELDSGITAVADSVAIDDTGLSSGLKGYLSYAAREELIQLENGKFAPNDSITLSNAAYTVVKALDLPITSSASDSSLNPAVAAMVSAGILDMEDITQSDEAMTKSSAAKLLYRIEKYIKDNNIQINGKKMN